LESKTLFEICTTATLRHAAKMTLILAAVQRLSRSARNNNA